MGVYVHGTCTGIKNIRSIPDVFTGLNAGYLWYLYNPFLIHSWVYPR